MKYKTLQILYSLILFQGVHAWSIDWSWTINEGPSTFSSTEGDSGTTLSGSFTRLANGFLEMTVTGGAGDLHPGNGTKFYPIEVPGFFIASPPLLSNETQISYGVISGDCPTTTIKYNWNFQGWNGDNNSTSGDQGAWGEFRWSSHLNRAWLDSIYNVTSYTGLSWFGTSTPFTVSSCSAGVADVTFGTPNTDRSGKLYLSRQVGMIYRTDANRLIVGVPQKRLPSSGIFSDSYTAYLSKFDTAGSISDNIHALRLTIGSTGTDGVGSAYSNISTSSSDGTFGAVSLTIDAINSPKDGMIQASLTRGGNTGKLGCSVHFTSRSIFFCSGQDHGTNTKPANLVLVSDTSKVGALDQSFGTSGTLSSDFSQQARYNSSFGLTRSSSGEMVSFGHTYQTDGLDKFLFIKFSSDGNIDTTFGTSGAAYVNFDGSDGQREGLNGAVIHSDGSITAVGWYNTSDQENASLSDLIAIRLDSSGALDTSFGSGGRLYHSKSRRKV